MDNSYKVKEIINKMKEYSGKHIVIKGEIKSFNIDFTASSIPHLLGLHYSIPENERTRIKGNNLLNKVLNENSSDNEILKKVCKYNPKQYVENVKKRIETFDYFMKNLEHGIIVNKTLIGGNLNVNYLIIQKEPKDSIEDIIKSNDFLHLGILSGNVSSLIEEYLEDKDILKTYFYKLGNDYFKNSKIFDNVVEILEYDEKLETYIPFSFDEKKREILIKEWKKEKDIEKFNYKEVLLQSKEINNRKRNIEIPKVTKEKEGNER